MDEALEVSVVLTERGQKTVHVEQQKCYLELSKKTFPSSVERDARPFGPPDIKFQCAQSSVVAPMGRNQCRPSPAPPKESEQKDQ